MQLALTSNVNDPNDKKLPPHLSRWKKDSIPDRKVDRYSVDAGGILIVNYTSSRLACFLGGSQSLVLRNA
jgi:hypothetical protein